MRQLVAPVLIAFGVVTLCPASAAEPVPRCLRLFTADIQELGWEEARRVFRAVEGYDDQAREGSRLVLLFRETKEDGAQRLAQALRNFRYDKTVPNPFPSDRELMAALAELDKLDPNMANFGRVIGDLGQENALGMAQAAAFDLYVARDSAALGIEGFQVERGVGNVSRVYDVCLKTGRCLENKSLVVPYSIGPNELTAPALSADGRLFVYQDQRLTQLADETARSVVLHVGDGYELFGTNFRNLPQMVAQRGDIERVMVKQFDSGLVRQTFGTDPAGNAAREAARDTFLARLPDMLQFK